MKLTWRQFELYLDAFLFWMREESEDGKKENRSDDREYLAAHPEYVKSVVSDVEEIKRKAAKFAARGAKGKGVQGKAKVR